MLKALRSSNQNIDKKVSGTKNSLTHSSSISPLFLQRHPRTMANPSSPFELSIAALSKPFTLSALAAAQFINAKSPGQIAISAQPVALLQPKDTASNAILVRKAEYLRNTHSELMIGASISQEWKFVNSARLKMDFGKTRRRNLTRH